MSKMFLVNKRVSETPAYWTAHYSDNIVNQINENGEISEKWSSLPVDSMEYWGLISNLGCYGFYIKDGVCDLNGIKLRIEVSGDRTLSYRRKILSSSEGWSRTKSVEISYCGYVIVLIFLPESKIVFVRQQ